MRATAVVVPVLRMMMIATLISAVVAIESVANSNCNNSSNNNYNNNNFALCTTSFSTPLTYSENVISTPNSANEKPSNQQHEHHHHQQRQQQQQHFSTVNNTPRDPDTYTASTINATIAATGKNNSEILNVNVNDNNNNHTATININNRPNSNNEYMHDAKNDKAAAVGTGNAFHDKINTSNQRMEFNGRSRHHQHSQQQHQNIQSNNNKNSVESSLYESVELQEAMPLYQQQQEQQRQQQRKREQQHEEHRERKREREHERQRRELLSLHRQKRYLVFPESSSFQMIFDLIIPIVDWTNFAIMGITCAVAWELPSKPPSEIIENFRDKLNEGTFGYSRRNDSTQQQIQYVDNKQATTLPPVLPSTDTGNIQNILTKTTDFENSQSLTPSYYYAPRPWNHYEATMPPAYQSHFGQQQYRPGSDFGYRPDWRPDWRQNTLPKYYKTKHNFWYTSTNKSRHKAHEDDWWERNKQRLVKNWRTQQHQWNKFNNNNNNYNKNQNIVSDDITPQRVPIPIRSTERSGRSRKLLQTTPRHHIYPVFGKRRRRRQSADEHSDFERRLQQLHLHEQLRTRQKLYGKIEKLYKIRGHNGTACVLRALCETAQSTQRAQSLQRPRRRRRRQHHKQNWNSNLNWNWNSNGTWRRDQRQLHGEPQSFIMELLRAIFTLPTHNAHPSGHIATHYWQAHTYGGYGGHGTESDCVQHYAQYCEHSIWQQKPF